MNMQTLAELASVMFISEREMGRISIGRIWIEPTPGRCTSVYILYALPD
jgi:hypothetical protein